MGLNVLGIGHPQNAQAKRWIQSQTWYPNDVHQGSIVGSIRFTELLAVRVSNTRVEVQEKISGLLDAELKRKACGLPAWCWKAVLFVKASASTTHVHEKDPL